MSLLSSEKDSLSQLTYSGVMVEMSEQSLRVGISGDAEPRAEYPTVTGVLDASLISPASKSLRFFPLDGNEIRYDTAVVKSLVYNSKEQHYVETALCYALERNGKHRFMHLQAMPYLFSAPKHQPLSSLAKLPVLVLEAARTSRALRQVLAEIFFSSLEMEGVFFGKTPALATFGCGRTSGIVWDSGYSCTKSSVVIQGYTVPSSVVEIPLGGAFFNKKLQTLLQKNNSPLLPPYVNGKRQLDSESQELNIHESYKRWSLETLVETVKRQSCFFLNKSETCQNKASNEHVLPDGTRIQTDGFAQSLIEPLFSGLQDKDLEQFKSALPENDFSHTKWGCVSMLQEALKRSLADTAKTKSCLDAIILTGGNVLFPGFFSRFKSELDITPSLKYKVLYPPQKHLRRHAPFIGASILSCLGSFQNFLVTRQEYDEQGSVIFEKKCP